MQLSLIRIHRARKRYFSQSGEDGALEFILSKLPSRDHWLVEFGAWDGRHLSNCYHLIKDFGYQGVLIEVEKERFSELEKNMAIYGQQCVCLNEKVGFSGNEKLDAILSKTNLPYDFDLLSIDIDSDDYQVWEALTQYAPKLVIVEINNRNLPGIHLINEPGSSFALGESGTSFSAMDQLAQLKGYSLVAMIGCDAIFIRNELFHFVHKSPLSPEVAFTYEGHSRKELNFSQIVRKLQFMILSRSTKSFS